VHSIWGVSWSEFEERPKEWKEGGKERKIPILLSDAAKEIVGAGEVEGRQGGDEKKGISLLSRRKKQTIP